jgi:hypothetical protein
MWAFSMLYGTIFFQDLGGAFTNTHNLHTQNTINDDDETQLPHILVWSSYPSIRLSQINPRRTKYFRSLILLNDIHLMLCM